MMWSAIHDMLVLLAKIRGSALRNGRGRRSQGVGIQGRREHDAFVGVGRRTMAFIADHGRSKMLHRHADLMAASSLMETSTRLVSSLDSRTW